ncbi:MAG: energy transducer TonB [Calditrichia bacterium]
MAHNERIYKDPEVDLKLKYRRYFEASLIIALVVIIGVFYSFKKFESGYELEKKVDVKIETIEIPQTEQIQKPPPPARPSIPVASEDEDIPDELTIEETEIDFDQVIQEEAPPPPPEEDEPIVEFYALSEKPEVVKRVEPVYPDLARKAGIEGMVVTKVLIDTKGDVEDVQIIKSHPMLDDAALAAARQFKFKPGKQRDRFVKVWMTIPFTFRLKQ